MLKKLLKIPYHKHLLFSISGLSFWFFLGFPFAGYHESYEWIAQVETIPALDLIFSYVGHYASYRPLGQFLAILLYKISNHSLAAIQIFNYLVSILAVIFILKPNSEKSLPLPVTFFLIGSIFFPAFSYLFHLHGFFYSPLALQFALLYYYSLHEFSSNNILKTFFITLLAGLFHPFAFIIFIAFIAGWSVENKNAITQKIIILDSLLVGTLIALIFLLVNGPFLYLTLENLAGIYNIFASLESKTPMLLLSFLFSAITAYNAAILPKSKYILLSMSVLLSVIFVLFNVPLIFLVIIICLLKLIYRKKWSLVFLMIILLIFPLFAGTISKHLKFLILFLLPVSIALDLKWPGIEKHKLTRKIVIIPAILLMVLILLKLNIRLPVISGIAYPLLAEKEKSSQLESALNWLRSSDYKNHTVEFQASGDDDKFPASTANINTYLKNVNPETQKSLKVVICFACDPPKENKVLYSANGSYSKNIIIFLP